MVKLSDEYLSLILLEVSLRLSDKDTICSLKKQGADFCNDLDLLVGLGQVDYLLLLHGVCKSHPLITLPNVRLANVVRCHSIIGNNSNSTRSQVGAATMISCAKINPKVAKTKGFASISETFFRRFEQLKNKYQTEQVAMDAYVTLGWPDIIVIINSKNIHIMLDSVLEIRSMVADDIPKKPYLFSTTFSQLFFNCSITDEQISINGETGKEKFDFFTKIYCKPGGHLSVLPVIQEYSPFFMLGKKDIGMIWDSVGVAECMSKVLKLRKQVEKALYATKTEIFFSKSNILEQKP